MNKIKSIFKYKFFFRVLYLTLLFLFVSCSSVIENRFQGEYPKYKKIVNEILLSTDIEFHSKNDFRNYNVVGIATCEDHSDYTGYVTGDGNQLRFNYLEMQENYFLNIAFVHIWAERTLKAVGYPPDLVDSWLEETEQEALNRLGVGMIFYPFYTNTVRDSRYWHDQFEVFTKIGYLANEYRTNTSSNLPKVNTLGDCGGGGPEPIFQTKVGAGVIYLISEGDFQICKQVKLIENPYDREKCNRWRQITLSKSDNNQYIASSMIGGRFRYQVEWLTGAISKSSIVDLDDYVSDENGEIKINILKI